MGQKRGLGELALAKLKTSGLDAKDGERLGMEGLSRAQSQALGFAPLAALKIPYFGTDGKPISDWPKGRPYFRVRYLEEAKGFDALSEKKPQRYAQEPNTAPVAYYPRNQDWRLVRDPKEPLLVTEGELKAAKACKEGFPAVGLGGVYNWRSPKMGIAWLPSLDLVEWVRRPTYLVFDSDVRGNKMVQAALKELADELVRRGAVVFFAALPELKGLKKVGLDDYLVHAPDAADGLRDILHRASPLGLASALWDINERYVYVRDPGLVYGLVGRSKTAPSAFKDHVESTAVYQEGELKGDKVVYSPASASAAWLKWPLRSEAQRLTYRPGGPAWTDERELNIWPGWGVQPKKGGVRPFLELLDHLFEGAEPEARAWFLKWCAYPLQRPGTKLFTTAVFHGVRHGTGKSFVGYTLGRIYGKNFTEISQMDLHNHFNEWAEGKQFVLGDDVTGPNRRADADFLKKLITQRELRVNGKYVPTYVVPDCVNYFFTANHPDSFFLEDDDRRFFIHEVTVGPKPERFYTSYERWLDREGGAQAIFRHLLDLDTSGFNPSGPAFRTAAKERMTENVRSDLASWVRRLRAAPEDVLKVGEVSIEKDLFTANELLELYDPDRRTGTSAGGLGRELSRAGVRQVCSGRPVRACGAQNRYYAVREDSRWLAASPSAVAAHLEGFVASFEKRASKY